MTKRIIYLCNALDEETRNVRSITTDSPAATKKVFGLCQALQVSGMATTVLSMGRGRQNGSGGKFIAQKRNIDHIQVIYAAFWHVPFVTHFVTAFSLMALLGKYVRRHGVLLLVYNRCWHYIPALFLAKVFRMNCFLDLEDGWIRKKSVAQKMLTIFFDWACNAGSILACEALEGQVKTRHNIVCYGTASISKDVRRQWHGGKLQVLFGGSLCEGTGTSLFIRAVKVFIHQYPSHIDALHIVVVGFGDMSENLRSFAMQTNGLVEFRGSVSNKEYQQLLDESHVGLCLKLTSGPFHDSTFPSKVIEISSHGLLVLSTPVSDVPKLFSSENALLLPSDSPEKLAEAWHWMVTNRQTVEKLASKGRLMALEAFSSESVGSKAGRFFEGV